MDTKTDKEMYDRTGKFCNPDCCNSFSCGNKHQMLMPLINPESECPLKHYNAYHGDLSTVVAGETTLEDCYTMCYKCQYRKILSDGTIDRSEHYEAHCLDCPAHAVEENITDGMAEAACN